ALAVFDVVGGGTPLGLPAVEVEKDGLVGGGGFPGGVVGFDLIGWDVAAAIGLIRLLPGEKVGVGGVGFHLGGILGNRLDDVAEAGLAGGLHPGVTGHAAAFAFEADEGVDAAVFPLLEAGGGLVPDAD